MAKFTVKQTFRKFRAGLPRAVTRVHLNGAGSEGTRYVAQQVERLHWLGEKPERLFYVSLMPFEAVSSKLFHSYEAAVMAAKEDLLADHLERLLLQKER